MNITFSPQLRDDITLASLSKVGDVLTVNGTMYDFSVIANGQTASEDAFTGDLVVYASRDFSGVLSVTLRLPYTDPEASASVTFPDTINDAADGVIGVPGA